jgi:hypothetical protein
LTKKDGQIWLLIGPIWLLKVSNVNNFTKSPVRFLKVRAASGKLSDVKFQNQKIKKKKFILEHCDLWGKKNLLNLVMSSLTLPRWFGRIRKKKKKIPSNDSDETDSKGSPFQGHGLQNSRSLPATPRKDSTVVVL